MRRLKGQRAPYPTQFHVITEAEDLKKVRVVAAEEGKDMSQLFREIFMVEIDRRYLAIRGQGNGKARPQ